MEVVTNGTWLENMVEEGLSKFMVEWGCRNLNFKITLTLSVTCYTHATKKDENQHCYLFSENCQKKCKFKAYLSQIPTLGGNCWIAISCYRDNEVE